MCETGFDPPVRKIPEGGHGNPLQYSCLENPMDRRAWWATVNRYTHTHTRGFFWRKQSFYSSGISNRHLIYLTYWKQGFMTIHLLCTSKYTKPAGPQSSGTLLTQGCSGVLCRHENSGQDHGQELATASTRTGRSELDSGGAQVLPHPWKVTNR